MTGSQGFAASYLVPLLAKSYEVITTDRHSTENACDLLSTDKVRNLIVDLAPDMLVHLGGISSLTDGAPPDLMHKINVEGTRAVCDGLASLNKKVVLLFVSSGLLFKK